MVFVQNQVIFHGGAHENRRISLETNRSSGSDESIGTGFSYEDSAGSQSIFPSVHFSHSSQHQNIENEQSQIILGNNEALRSYKIDCSLLQDMKTIGEGAFGVVAKATMLQQRKGREKQIVAVKMLKGVLKNYYKHSNLTIPFLNFNAMLLSEYDVIFTQNCCSSAFFIFT